MNVDKYDNIAYTTKKPCLLVKISRILFTLFMLGYMFYTFKYMNNFKNVDIDHLYNTLAIFTGVTIVFVVINLFGYIYKIKVCSNCGNKLDDTQHESCTSCGFKIIDDQEIL